MKQNVIGIDIGATKTIVALASASGEILKEKAFKSQDLLKSIVDTIKELSPENDFSAIGIGCPRLFMEESKRLLSELIEKDLSLAFNKKIVIVNDAQAGALGEYKFGSGVGSKNMIYITVSTGVGAGLILNGSLYKGSFGMAGEAGHVSMNIAGPGCACGNFGCLHMLVSGTAMAMRAKQMLADKNIKSRVRDLVQGDLNNITADIISKAAEENDTFANDLILQTGKILAVGILDLINVIDPDCVVVGGGVANIGEKLLQPTRELLSRQLFKRDIKISLAKQKDRSVLLGAIALAI